jgi:Putative Actinobacterial Holin-X, holin superfamily III
LPPDNGRSENFAQAVAEVSERMSVLVREEIELAKAEMSQKATSIGKGAIAVGAGMVFGVFAIIFALETLAWGLDRVLVNGAGDLWIGFIIVFGVLAILALLAFLFAWRKLRVGAPTPHMAIDEAKKIRATVAAKSEDGSTEMTVSTEVRR